MAAPATTARSTPPGIKIRDGYSSKIAFARDPDFDIFEVEVGLPSPDGGELIDITDMFNVLHKTKYPRSLIDWEGFDVLCHYDPDAYNQFLTNLVNKNGSITVHVSDGSTVDFWGVAMKLTFSRLVEGSVAEGTLTVGLTNLDTVNNVEAGPVITSVAGT
jgi:hypothetical protein